MRDDEWGDDDIDCELMGVDELNVVVGSHH